MRLTSGPKENGSRPAVDPLFRSAALHYGPRAIGVILSGNLKDGTAGLLSIKRRGGVAVVQSLESALYAGMPRSAIEHVEVDHVAPAAELAGLLIRLAGEPVPDQEAEMVPGGGIETDEHAALEAALWTALRALEEHGALSRRLAGRAKARRHFHSASSFTEQAMGAEHHASFIRHVLSGGRRRIGTGSLELRVSRHVGR